METRISEIADGIYRLSTFVPGDRAASGFTFNQFLIDADEPLLFHCGPRAMFSVGFGRRGASAAAGAAALDRVRPRRGPTSAAP